MGFAGPFTGTGYGSPHPFYGLKPPIVPGYPGAPGAPGIPGVPGSSGGGLDTRIAGGGSFAGVFWSPLALSKCLYFIEIIIK